MVEKNYTSPARPVPHAQSPARPVPHAQSRTPSPVHTLTHKSPAVPMPFFLSLEKCHLLAFAAALCVRCFLCFFGYYPKSTPHKTRGTSPTSSRQSTTWQLQLPNLSCSLKPIALKICRSTNDIIILYCTVLLKIFKFQFLNYLPVISDETTVFVLFFQRFC